MTALQAWLTNPVVDLRAVKAVQARIWGLLSGGRRGVDHRAEPELPSMPKGIERC